MPLQFGDPGLAEAMLHGSSLGIDAARLELSQRAEAARRAEIAQEQALRNREQTFRETEFNTRRSDDAAARDSMLSQIESTAQMPAPQGDEGDFFAQPTPVTGPITPEMRRAPASAITATFHAALSNVQHQRALQEESDRYWAMYRNLRKQGLARMVSPETYDRAVAAGVVWDHQDAPPERQPLDLHEVMRQLSGATGIGSMADIAGPQLAGADTSGLLRMDHTNLGMLGRLAAKKPQATTADWLAAGATPDQAAGFARMGGTVEDVERFATHKMTIDAQDRRAREKLEPTDDEINAVMQMHGRQFPTREAARLYVLARKSGLVNQLDDATKPTTWATRKAAAPIEQSVIDLETRKANLEHLAKRLEVNAPDASDRQTLARLGVPAATKGAWWGTNDVPKGELYDTVMKLHEATVLKLDNAKKKLVDVRAGIDTDPAPESRQAPAIPGGANPAPRPEVVKATAPQASAEDLLLKAAALRAAREIKQLPGEDDDTYAERVAATLRPAQGGTP